MPKLSIVIPTLNEEKTIGKVIDAIPWDILRKIGYETEVLAVDGGSYDRTVEIALKKGARVLTVRKKGYGLAYLVGFKFAKGDIIVTLDADMTYPPDEIPKLLLVLERLHLDYVSANRFIRFDKEAFTKIHLLGNKLIRLLTFLLFRIRICDTQSGMWCFRRELLNSIRLTSSGMEFSTEIKLKVVKKFKFREVPIYYHKRVHGRSKINLLEDGLRILIFILKYRLLQLLE